MPGAMPREGWGEFRRQLLEQPNHTEPLSTQTVLVSWSTVLGLLCTKVVCVCSQAVSQILVGDGRAVGVRLEDGTEVLASAVLSNATPKVTFLDLLEEVSCDTGYMSQSSTILLAIVVYREH